MSGTQQVQVQSIVRRWDPDGNRDRPISYLRTFTGLIYGKGAMQQIAASSASAQTLWDRTSATELFQPSATNGFDYAFFAVDNPLYLEFTTNTGQASAACWAQLVTSQAPLILGSAKAYKSVTNGASATAFTGTTDLITRVRCWEASGNIVNLNWEIRSST